MNKLNRFLFIGLLGAVIGTAGELLGGLAPSVNYATPVTALFSSLASVAPWRLGLCAVIGGIGILLQYFGYYCMGLSFEDRENFRGRLYFTANRGFTIIGAIFHVLCCAFLFLYQLTVNEAGSTEILSGFLLWFMAPFTLLFLLSYLTASFLLLVQIGSGSSRFPRWCCLLNPLVLNLLIQGIALLVPGSAIVNGIRFASMGISSIVIFSILPIVYR